MARTRVWQFSSESVAPGHPDKACDQISDLVTDFFLARDPEAKVAAESMISDRMLMICGEFKTDDSVVDEAKVALPYQIRDLLKGLYPEPSSGFDWAGAKKGFELKKQSADISQGVEQSGGQIGAGDQGLMFGFACDETEEMMPQPIALAHALMRRQHELFLEKKHGLGSDAKAQVTVRYEGWTPISVEKVVLSTQHAANVEMKALEELIREEVVKKAIPGHLRSAKMELMVNPTGRFVVGGPQGDTGLTGRKIIVDTYGGAAPHGGGAFSGKDPTKVDRSAAYMARCLAKAMVKAGLASRCVTQIAYAIGRAQPVSFYVDFQGTGLTSFTESLAEKLILAKFDLSPKGIIDFLNLRRPIYQKTAVFGHFGRELDDFTWETSGANSACEIIESTLKEMGG